MIVKLSQQSQKVRVNVTQIGVHLAGQNPLTVKVNQTGVKVVQVGQQGLPGVDGAMMVVGEIPTGLVNGANATFTTAFDFIPESVQVFVNGLSLKKLDDFITTGDDTIQLNVSPVVGDNIFVNYYRV